MKTNNVYIKGIKNAARRLALGCLLLFASFGSLVAQNDSPFVIKNGDNYLAHEKVNDEWVIQNATVFSPNCLWYSSNNYNYYLLDGDDRMYLKAPLERNGAITIAPNPGTNHLGLTTQDYFFYDWDKGLARGVQEFHENGSCPDEYNIGDNSECWKAVWVSYENSQWQMSSVYGYDQTTYAADFYPVTVTEHAMVVTPSGESDLGLTALDVPATMEAGFSGEQISATIENFAYTYIPAYTTYFFDGGTHNYYAGSDHGNTTPSSQSGSSTISDASYEWTISCEGHYLTFDDGGDWILTSYESSPTIYYPFSSIEGRKVATITLTVTYANTGATQTMSEDVVLLVECQNPGIIDEEITYQGVTISWYPTADAFQVMWKINDENVTEWNNSGNLTTTTYTFPGLEYSTSYLYKVKAICTPETDDPTQHDFTTLAEPNLVVAGAIFGGGRMANVTGNTEVVVVNCDYIDAVYGGNDIAGEVQGADGAKITIGVNTGDTNGYDTDYGTTDSPIKIGSVYGGGNGYYAYNGTSFVPATENYTSETVEAGASVNAMTQSHTVGDVVWTNDGTNPETLDFPSIVKTAITVSNNFVNVDSIFGGAKNAFLTYNNYRYAGDSIAINGGTILAVFGGNNFGGDQGYGKHHIEVNGTTTSLVPTNEVSNTATTGFGREFGIRYLYGGGNKVYGSTTEVFINGGQCDTIFAGGNAADVYAANLTVNCAIAAGSDENTYGHVYSNAIATYDGSTITPKDDYEWDGISGIYNIRTLFGGNNQADFDSRHNNKVPTITLTSGSIGTVYGGGNAGNMLGLSTDDGDGDVLTINGNTVKYGTHVAMNSANVLVDKLYGGCQVSDVSYSTWVEIQNGHVGYVFGGCNVSGDVGSTRVNMAADENNPDGSYQEVYGGTYVVAQGGTVYKNLFAGGNGYYHCVNENGFYTDVLSYDDPDNLYVWLSAPTHNETNVVVQPGATVKGNVYAGGNLAYVGFNNETVGDKPYPKLVGLASVRMSGGEVFGNVYGGGNMADVYGSNEVQVSGGIIHQSLYGGNDRMGKVAQMTNRKLPESYNTASDGVTSLLIPKVNTYVSLTKNPHITNVYGGGNGYYAYFDNFDDAEAYDGPKETVVSCDISNEPIQSSTFVDIAIDGGAEGGQIGTVYGGGDGVSVEGSLRVFLNVQGDNPTGYTNVGTIFGGNNKGKLELVSDIILLKGQVGTVYGGCNEGAMEATTYTKTVGDYTDIGSYVRLLSTYDGDGEGGHDAVIPNVKVMDAIYGGCRMNGVTNNSLVLVEGGDFSNIPIFGGSDISGTVSGWSRVAVTSGTVGNVYGGGNGNYDYVGHNVYVAGSDHIPADLVATSDNDVEKPHCVISGVDMISGTAANLYGGGNACGSDETVTNVEGGTVSTGIYGGSNASGTITGDVVVNVTGGTIGVSGTPANIHGGGFGAATTTDGDVTVNIGATDGGETPTYSGTAIIWGDVYGGSALGEVSATGKVTNVNFYKGTINGDVYGGGLGDETHAAAVSGDVLVNVYGGVFNDADGTPGGGNIYGCNNASGSPSGDVNVNIYATDHGDDYEHNRYPSAPPSPHTEWNVTSLASNAEAQTYAINAVFGGGNLAAYQPAAVGEGEDPHSATVHVYNCDNTIKDVFGGGNAADVGIGTSSSSGSTITRRADTYIYIEGGRIHRVIGGGNGEDLLKPAANIFGTANTTVYAGLIDEVYGGANRQGDVDAINLTMSNPSNSSLTNSCNHQVYGKVFGCANAADYNRSVTTNILCGVGEIGELYGGSNLAHIGRSDSNTAHVTLNIYGGTHAQVFAGSKGDLESLPGTGHTDQPSNIYGDVTLNLFGGIITDAYGGSNFNGNIAGTITVNVLDVEDPDCTFEALDLTNVYGASNMADYAPTFTPSSGTERISPVVNVIHIAQADGIRGNVYGGGNQASVTANPKVNIGYHHATMKQYIPLDANGDSLYHVPSTPRAYVKGNVFGGGNQAAVTGTDTVNLWRSNSYVNNVFGGGNQAGTTNTVVNVYDGTVNTNVYGGCNTSGTVTGDIKVNLLGGTVTQDVFGGGQGNATQTSGGILVTVDGSTVGRDVYGGSALGQVNDALADLTKVWLKSGTVGGNLYGGGMGQAGTADWGQLNGKVEVIVNGGTVTGSVFGCNNYNEQPAGTVKVYINETTPGTMSIGGNVYGGGNVAYYEGTPEVFIQNGTVDYKVFGGGNNITIDGKGVSGSHVVMTGGTVLEGIYGGCNTYGDVTGNSIVDIYGGTIGSTTAKANIHGGGYGQNTTVAGNVTVNFGQTMWDNSGENPVEIHDENLNLYGDLYGGSALGNVNTDADNTTTIHIDNGTIHGNVYGGGLGYKDEDNPTNDVEAKVYGRVYVVVGGSNNDPTPTFFGKASFDNGSIFGCNNLNGSPQDNVFVDVYQTNHTHKDEVEYTASDREYAIYQLFGGGNKANYAPENGFVSSSHSTNVHIHGCENTIEDVFGGSNAANSNSANTIVEGGRFDYIFGGGNGLVSPANVGTDPDIHHTYSQIQGGRVGWCFGGSNRQGNCINIEQDLETVGSCGELIIDYFFQGGNQADQYGEMLLTLDCSEAKKYLAAYGGCRLGTVYGNITVIMTGGTVGSLFGGNQGDEDHPAHVKRFPTASELETHPDDYSQELKDFINTQLSLGTDWRGKGGNINVIVKGGAVGNLYGGCDTKGNVDGKITVVVESEDNSCGLFVGNVYGASNHTEYWPENSSGVSPKVDIIKATVGGSYDFNDTPGIQPEEIFEGNVFGGGNVGEVVSNPKVIIGDGTNNKPVDILGSVYGGGNDGNVVGNPQVYVVPNTHTLSVTSDDGTVTVGSNAPSTSYAVGEDVDINIVATAAPRFAFDHWEVTGEGASVGKTTLANTIFTMGTENATLTAHYAPAMKLTLVADPLAGGTFKVNGVVYTEPIYVAPGTSVTVVATPAVGYNFNGWTVTGAGSSVTDTTTTTTHFTMGSEDAILKATFTEGRAYNNRNTNR